MATRYASPYATVDVEKAGPDYNEFAEKAVRLGFIKKVFGLLTAQLVLTTIIGAVMVFSAPVKVFVAANSWILVTAMLASFALIISFSVSEHCRKSHPLNLILLFGFTAAEGILVGAVSAQARTDIVVLAFATTAAVTAALCIYAMRTKNDFTTYGGMLYGTLLALVMTSFFAIFLRTPIVNTVISFVGAILFSAYLVYDVQMLMGGEHQHKISPDEYVMGAIAIYLDIIQIFLYILRILSENRSN